MGLSLALQCCMTSFVFVVIFISGCTLIQRSLGSDVASMYVLTRLVFFPAAMSVSVYAFLAQWGWRTTVLSLSKSYL